MELSPVARTVLTAVLVSVTVKPAQVHPRPAPLKMDVSLVLVPVTVTDRTGRTVLGLNRGNFRVFEEGVPQTITSFSREDSPVSLGLVFDISGSMKQKIGAARASLRALLEAAGSGDEALLLTCSTRPEMKEGLTTDVDGIERLLGAATAGGRTALIDSVAIALDRMSGAGNTRKALVIVSDGQDNYSRYSRRELMARAVESDVQIYTVGIYDPPRNRKPIELIEETRGVALLADLAHSTGGLHYEIRSAEEVPKAVENIARALHEQYVLGFHPGGVGPGWRRIQVKLDVPHVRLYARRRYFAPGR